MTSPATNSTDPVTQALSTNAPVSAAAQGGDTDAVTQVLRTGRPVAAPTAQKPANASQSANDPVMTVLRSGRPVDSTGVPVAPSKGGPATPPPEETVSRVSGLGERALIRGLGQLVDVPGALTHLADRAGGSVHDYIRGMFGLDPDAAPTEPMRPLGTQVATAAANALGLPKPATPTERTASAAVSGLPSALVAPEAPIAGAISGALGGSASQAVAEKGGGPLAQTLAGLAAGASPAGTAALIRGVTRGGAAGAAATTQRLADAAASGTPLTAGQATGSSLLQKIEASGSKVWGGGAYRKTAQDQTENLGSTVDSIVDRLSGGKDVSPTSAGEAINKGAETTRASMKTAERAAYAAVDQHVPPDTGIDISGTQANLDRLAAPTKGAEATTSALIPPKLSQLRENLATDVAANGGQTTLPYSAVRSLKTALGNSIDWGFAPADPTTNGALKSVYGSLKDDITQGVSTVSPQAKNAMDAANALHGANAEKLERLAGIVDKNGGPEAVYQAATNGTRQGATKIGTVMGALDADQQNLVRATVLQRMGRAPASLQNAAGDQFNASTFLTNWAKMSHEAKDALFGAAGNTGTLRSSLDSLAQTMSTIRGSTLFKNPSGTAEAAGHSYGLLALLGEGGAALMGHPHALYGTTGAIAANMVLSRALTNPRTAAWLAQSTKLPIGALPNAVNRLRQDGEDNHDQDAIDLANMFPPDLK